MILDCMGKGKLKKKKNLNCFRQIYSEDVISRFHVSPCKHRKQEGNVYVELLYCLVPKTNRHAPREKEI